MQMGISLEMVTFVTVIIHLLAFFYLYLSIFYPCLNVCLNKSSFCEICEKLCVSVFKHWIKHHKG